MTKIRIGGGSRVSQSGTLKPSGTYVGEFDPSVGLPTTGSGRNNSILKGDYWKASGSGTITGVEGFTDFVEGDFIYASVNRATVATQFFGNKKDGGSGGSGDVSGPASSTDGNIVTFDSTTGKVIQDSGVGIANVTTLDGTQTNSGAKTFLDNTLFFRNIANTISSHFSNTNTSARTYTLPDFTGRILVSGGTNVLSGNTVISFDGTNSLTFTFSSGTAADTFQFGGVYGGWFIESTSSAGTEPYLLWYITDAAMFLEAGPEDAARGVNAHIIEFDGTDGLVYYGPAPASDNNVVNRGYVLGSKTFTGSQTFRTSTTSASTAPIYIPAGTLMTTPENTAIENNGTHLYYTTGGTRYQLDQQLPSNYSEIVARTILNQTTGTVVAYTAWTWYGTPASPETGNITESLTSALAGLVQRMYHNNGTEPTYPAGWVQVGTGTYSTGNLNIIHFMFISGTRVEYWITQ